jgi:hypothetical protein
MLDDHVGAIVDRADAERADGLRLREGEGVVLDPGRLVDPCLGLAAAAEEDGQEGEEERAQDVMQAHVSHHALGVGAGGALRPAAGENLHSVSLSHRRNPVQSVFRAAAAVRVAGWRALHFVP